MIEIKFTKNTETGYKIGDIVKIKENEAEEIIKEGYAEYFEEENPTPEKVPGMEEEKYNPEFEIKKLEETNKLFLTHPQEFDALKLVGFLNLVHDELLKFLDRKEPNGFYILYITDPDRKENKYPVKIKYEGAEIVEDSKDEEINFTYTNDKGKIKVSIPKVTTNLLFNYYFKTIFGKKDESVYVYNKGIYESKGKQLIKTKTEEFLEYLSSTHIVNEVYEKVKRNTAINYEDFETIPLKFICLENGIYDLDNKQLIDFDPKYYFKSRIPIFYDKNKKCEKILEFFNEVLYPEDIPILQEWFGFCLFRRYFVKKSIILFGEKNTGKTVILNILTKFLERKNIAGISLQRIASKDKFALASLKDKHANIYDDLSSDDLKDSGGFKIATGGGYITAEHKFGDSFQFMTFAKNIFSTNKIPNVKDINDDAYYERWIPIPCDNQIKKDDQDNFLFEKITTKDQMSGLFNWALEGLYRLLKNGYFSYKKNSSEIKTIMQRHNNPLVAFADEILKQRNGNRVSKEIMYRVYTKWCQEKKVPRLSKEQLGRNLAKYTNYMIAKGGKERVWENVIVDEKYDIFDTFN